MKRTPAVYTATEISMWHVSEEHKPGHWRPARPCALSGLRLSMRIKIAWMVFVGRMDALNWGDNSGEWSNKHITYRDITEVGFIRSGKEP